MVLRPMMPVNGTSGGSRRAFLEKSCVRSKSRDRTFEAGNEAGQTVASALLGRVDSRLESLLAEPNRRADGKHHENGEHKDLRHHERRLRLRRS